MKNHYVYAPIRGQLGNQMFQYAMLRSLGIETNSTPGFTYGEKWPFALDCFNISKEFISTLNPMESTINKVFRKVFKFCMNLCPSSHKKFVFQVIKIGIIKDILHHLAKNVRYLLNNLLSLFRSSIYEDTDCR